MTASTALAPRSVGELILRPEGGLTALSAYLEALDAAERVRVCRTLSARQLAALYELAGDGGPLTLDDFVPPGTPDETPVPFAGYNSLPLFRKFEKHFARVDGQIVGINVQLRFVSFFTGPGYYTTVPVDGSAKEVLFDYTRVPARTIAGWPVVKDNAGGLRKLVYGGMHDYNRRVAKGVVIGKATRLGKPIGQYYVLTKK